LEAAFRCALSAPPYGRRRAPLQPPPNSEGNEHIKQEVVPFCSDAVGNYYSALDIGKLPLSTLKVQQYGFRMLQLHVRLLIAAVVAIAGTTAERFSASALARNNPGMLAKSDPRPERGKRR